MAALAAASRSRPTSRLDSRSSVTGMAPSVHAREQAAALQLAEVAANGHVTDAQLLGSIGHPNEPT